MGQDVHGSRQFISGSTNKLVRNAQTKSESGGKAIWCAFPVNVWKADEGHYLE